MTDERERDGARRVRVFAEGDGTSSQGRREYAHYLNLDIPTVSGQGLEAQIISLSDQGEPTGWHTHTCEHQFVYVLNGWLELQFEDGTQSMVQAGGGVYIPGGVVHNESRMSSDMKVLEVTVPAHMGTEPADTPPAWRLS